MFQNSTNFAGVGLTLWDTQSATDMSGTFRNCPNLNPNLSGWDIGNVTTLNGMFDSATIFNQDISAWNVTSLTDAGDMLNNTAMSLINYSNLLVGWGKQSVNSGVTLGATGLEYANYFPGVTNLATTYSWTIGGTGTDVFYFPASIAALTNWEEMFKFGAGSTTNANYIDVSGWIVSANSDFSLWDPSMVTNVPAMFWDCNTNVTFDISGWDVGNITNMGQLFINCSKFNEDIGKWNVSNVTSMFTLLEGCHEFNQDISAWNVANVNNMKWMINDCTIFDQDLGNWNVAKVTTMSEMFAACTNFNQNLNLWNVGNVEIMYGMFKNCTNFDGNISNWDVGKVTRLDYMFSNAISFDQDLSAWDVANVINMKQTFYFANVFNQNIGSWNTSNVTDMHAMFDSALIFNQDISSWNTGNVTLMSSIFNGATAFNQDISGWNISSLTDATNMLTSSGMSRENYSRLLAEWANSAAANNVTNVTFGAGTIEYYSWADASRTYLDIDKSWTITDGGEYTGDIVGFPPSIEALTVWNVMWRDGIGNKVAQNPAYHDISGYVLTLNSSFVEWRSDKVTNMESMFFDCSVNVTLDISAWDVGNVTNMQSMFYNDVQDSSFNEDIGDWNVSNVENMFAMFFYATDFNQDIGSWDVRNVTNLAYMFSNANSFNQDLSAWSFPLCTNLQEMFNRCLIFNQNLDSWDVSHVINMGGLFSTTAQNLPLSSWDIRNVTDMHSMFSDSTFNQDISNWDTGNVTNMSYMFAGGERDCSFNQYIGGWNVSKVQDFQSMFENAFTAHFNQDISAWNTSSATTMRAMFKSNSGIFNYDIGGWDTGNVVTMQYMFYTDGTNAFNQDISAWDISGLTNAASMITSGTAFTDANYTNLLIGWSATAVAKDVSNVPLGVNKQYSSTAIAARALLTAPAGLNWTITDGGLYTEDVVFPASIAALTDWSQMFQVGVGNKVAQDPLYVDISGIVLTADSGFELWDPSMVTNINEMFKDCSLNISFRISEWDVGNVINMNALFYGTAPVLFNEDLSGWNTINVTSMDSVFNNCAEFNQDLGNWNVSNVTNFYTIFSGCPSFEGIGVEKWDVASAIGAGGIGHMFHGCNIFDQDLSGWDVSGIPNFEYTFTSCSNYSGTGLDKWHPQSATSMFAMFLACDIFNQDLSGWAEDISACTNMKAMFANCLIYPGTGLQYWNTSNVINMQDMFNGATAFNEDISGWDISGLTNATNMLTSSGMSVANYSNLLIGWAANSIIQDSVPFGAGTIKYSSTAVSAHNTLSSTYSWTITDGGLYFNNLAFPAFTGGDITNWSYMWEDGVGNTNFDYVEVSGVILTIDDGFALWDPSMVLNMNNMFNDCSINVTLDISGWDVGNVTNMSGMFRRDLSFNEDIGGWNTINVTNLQSMFQGPETANSSDFNQDLSAWNVSNVETLENMFWWASSFNQNLTDWNTSNVTNMMRMFWGSAFDYDLSWNTENVINMHGMFYETRFNKDLSFNTINVTDMGSMFAGDISFNKPLNFNTSNVINMSYMFTYNLDFNQDLSHFDVAKVTDMQNMFSGVASFETGDITGWNTINVENMNGMFRNAIAFNQDISGWNISNVINMQDMFNGATVFDQDLSWNISSLTNITDMFTSSAMATTYNTNSSRTVAGWVDSSNSGTSGVPATVLGSITGWPGGLYDFSYVFLDNATFLLAGGTNYPTSITTYGDVSGWNVSRLTNIGSGFKSNTTFNEDLSLWDTANVIYMNSMFENATAFNQDISGWDTANVTNMSGMFHSATSFDQDISAWDISSLTNATDMLTSSGMSTTNYSNLLIGWAANSTIQNSVPFGAGTIKYNIDASAARLDLLNNYLWTITDGGQEAAWTFTEGPSGSTNEYWQGIAISTDGVKVAASKGAGTGVNNRIWTSTNSGVSFTRQDGSSQIDWGNIASSSDGNKLAVLAINGKIWTSTDSGVTWGVAGDSPTKNWRCITSSADGTKLAAGTRETTREIWISSDSGLTWTDAGAPAVGGYGWWAIASSSDGTIIAAAHRQTGVGNIYVSLNSGTTWATNTAAEDWQGVAISSDGTKLVACIASGKIWISTDSGASWGVAGDSPINTWTIVSSSADGTILAAGGYISTDYSWISYDSGSTWTELTSGGQGNWTGLELSSDGTKIASCAWGSGSIWMGVNSGAISVSWTDTGITSRRYQGIDTNSDGSVVSCVCISEKIYTSTDTGVSFNTGNSISRYWQAITLNDVGDKMAAIERLTGIIDYSTDTGTTWANSTTMSVTGAGITSSGSGQDIYVALSGSGVVKKSTDSGATFGSDIGPGSGDLNNISCDATGTKVLTGSYLDTGDGIYITTSAPTGSGSWTNTVPLPEPTGGWPFIGTASSTNGEMLITCAISNATNAGYIWISDDSGSTWTKGSGGLPTASTQWTSVAISGDGTKMAAAIHINDTTEQGIWVSGDKGITWNKSLDIQDAWTNITFSRDGIYIYCCSDIVTGPPVGSGKIYKGIVSIG